MSNFHVKLHDAGSPLNCRNGFGRLNQHIACFAAVVLSVAAVGCAKPDTTLSGSVTLDGRAVEGATLQFYPEAGNGQTSHAVTDKAGKYVAKVSPVPLAVTISKSKPTGEKQQLFPDTPPIDKMAESLALRYSDRKKTELRVTPVPGKTTVADFVLTSAHD